MRTLSWLRNAFILSLLLHAVLVASVFLFDDKLKAPEIATVSVDFISPEDLEKFRKADELLQATQVVEQDENVVNQEVSENAKFLSAKNQKVQKEMMAANRGDFKNERNRVAAKPGAITKPQTNTKPTAEQIKNLFSSYDPAASFERQKKNQTQQLAGENSPEAAQGSGSVSQTNDYNKNIDRGLETLLNTREFKYYSYYNRIRRQLAQHWEGKVREKLSKMYKERRAPASLNEDKTTKIIVVLNSTGTLVKVQIIGDSGVRDLDDAAVEAFRAAAPFPNPPRGIIEQDGTVKIRWDFVLET